MRSKNPELFVPKGSTNSLHDAHIVRTQNRLRDTNLILD